jgi:glycogen debranching enzyme
VVLNHTGESDLDGPTLALRGLDHRTYYLQDRGVLFNDTGCGNTVALNQTDVTAYAVAALRKWVEATGIDGFRFDLASVMGRSESGFSASAPLLLAITADPVLSTCILIAEPWDVGPGGYQLGQFPPRWPEWNDKFRDDVRRFWRGDEFSANALATRIAGSSDVFSPGKTPSCSVNFIAAHDGFTLSDVTRYSAKNNIANGEDNRDGKPDEVTCNSVTARTLLASLFLSRGTPMLTAGDEFGRTQGGNNNAYAQDNETTWLDWGKRDQQLLAFTARLVRLRADHGALHDNSFLTNTTAHWMDRRGNKPNWHDAQLRFVVLVVNNSIAIVVNGSSERIAVPLKKGWSRLISSGEGDKSAPQSVSVYVRTAVTAPIAIGTP